MHGIIELSKLKKKAQLIMRYQQIIFDVDDTLIDFAATENYALHHLFQAHHWPLSRALQSKYHAYNEGLWRKLEKGQLTYQQLTRNCFHDFLQKYLHLQVDGVAVMREYRSYFGETHQLLPGVKDTLKFARRRGYQLAVLTNGEEYMQRYRLKLAGILNYFSLIVTSERAGFAKPDPRIFAYFFKHSPIGPEKTIFFGDGLRPDILGATHYGLSSVWYNHRHRKNNLYLRPLFEVQNYQQLVKLIQRDFQMYY